jgi:HD-GYP domain-containing protein (c-di-GMP phosphodiesterase class II)
MGLSEEEMVHVRRGALLHDIGKLGVPDNILLKPGKLTDEEWVIMKKHPVIAHELLAPISFLRQSLDIPYCHHEKWDGSGYPRGLKGEQIPLAARIFSIVDVWDALRSDRPYRPAWPKEKTTEHIVQLSGSHFDPNVVELFINIMKSEGV